MTNYLMHYHQKPVAIRRAHHRKDAFRELSYPLKDLCSNGSQLLMLSGPKSAPQMCFDEFNTFTDPNLTFQ